MMYQSSFLFLLFLLGNAAAATAEVKFKTGMNSPDGFFPTGSDIILSAIPLDQGKAISGKTIEYSFYQNGRAVKNGQAPSEHPVVFRTSLDKPGWVHLNTTLKNTDGSPVKRGAQNISGAIGALVAPDQLRIVAAEPEDFDAFWQARREELDRIPLRVERRELSCLDAASAVSFRCYEIKVDCTDRIPVSGYLVIPKNATLKSLPACVMYQSYGVKTAIPQPKRGAISLTVNAHGILNGQPAEYYEKEKKRLGWYPTTGKNDPRKYYFKNMYQRVMRALDYIKTLPEWNGKTLIVSGGSQGGAQAIAAAALAPQVTLCVANVPAMGDHGGLLADRKSGWPSLYGVENGHPDNPLAARTAGYFDNVNFAKRIKCEIFLGAGFVDMIVAPTSVFVVYNNLIHAKYKSIESAPGGGHGINMPKAEKRIQELLTNKQ